MARAGCRNVGDWCANVSLLVVSIQKVLDSVTVEHLVHSFPIVRDFNFSVNRVVVILKTQEGHEQVEGVYQPIRGMDNG